MNFDHLVRSCAGLVTVDTGSQIVRLIHQTAQDFFGTRASEYFPDAHTRLTRTCLTYLSFDEFSKGPCDTSFVPEEPIRTGKNMCTRLERNPFMYYAACYWGHHARGEATERALEREILDLLSTPGTLASTVQMQYAIKWPDTERSLGSSKHMPIHVVLSFKLEHILEALLKTVTAENLNVEDETKKTAFHWAVELGLAHCASTLLAAGADIRTQDNHGCTALYKASALGYESIEKMIFEHNGAKLSKKEIRRAVLSNRVTIIETYMRAAPRPIPRANLMLLESSFLGRPAIIARAMSFGADINIKDGRGCTPLLIAVENGRSAAAEALVTAGASTTVLEASGKSLLQVAVSSQNIFKERMELMTESVESWLKRGGPLRVQVNWNQVEIAGDSQRNFLECFSSLLDTNHENPATFSEVMAAVNEDREHVGIIRLLLSHGADPRVKTSEGETLLHLATGSAPRIKVLLELAPVLDVNAQDNQGRSALHHAAASGNHATMDVLIASGANVKLRDFGGASTLHYAVGHLACVISPIQNGSSTKAVDSRKRTALHYFTLIARLSQKQEDTDQLEAVSDQREAETETDEPEAVLNQLLEASVDPNAIDSQGRKAFDYLRDSSIDSHGFEETVRWICLKLKEGQCPEKVFNKRILILHAHLLKYAEGESNLRIESN